MKKEQRDELLKSLANSLQGEALKDYLEEILDDVNSIAGISSVEEMIGRQISYKYLKEVIKFLYKEEKKVIGKTGPGQYV